MTVQTWFIEFCIQLMCILIVPKAKWSSVIAFQCGSLSMYIFLYMITGFQRSFERKTYQFPNDSNYFLFLI